MTAEQTKRWYEALCTAHGVDATDPEWVKWLTDLYIGAFSRPSVFQSTFEQRVLSLKLKALFPAQKMLPAEGSK